MMDQEYTFPAEIELVKGKSDSDPRLPVSIVASTPIPDKVNDVIVLKAFDGARESFLKEGVLDYDHGSIRSRTDEEKAKAIIGQPEELDTKSGKAVVSGFLFKGNPIVRDSILPALQADSRVYGASVGGRILRKSFEWDDTAKRKVNKISKISLNHIAITPLYKSVAKGTSLTLAKNLDEDEGLLQFDSFESFAKSFAKESEEDTDLDKAMVAGEGVTDYSTATGGAALQPQSLEEDLLRLVFDDFLKDVRSGALKPSLHSILGWLSLRGFTPEKAQEIAGVLAKKAKSIRKVLTSTKKK